MPTELHATSPIKWRSTRPLGSGSAASCNAPDCSFNNVVGQGESYPVRHKLSCAIYQGLLC